MPVDTFQPWIWLRNPHVQTILAVFAKGSAFPHSTVRRRVRLADGDQLVLHDTAPPSWHSGDAIAVLVHGLGGNHRSGGIVRLGRLLIGRGVRIVRLDLRGAGAGFALARGCYNAGCSADVRAALAAMHRLLPASPIWLTGISLGGNVALKLAGETAEHPVPGLARVAVIAPPVDLESCLGLLTHPRNRVYERHFVHELLTLRAPAGAIVPRSAVAELSAANIAADFRRSLHRAASRVPRRGRILCPIIGGAVRAQHPCADFDPGRPG